MNLARFSVMRPVFTTMITLIIVTIGAVSLSRLPIDLFPEISLPTLTVDTEYENASPEEMERLVTEVIEETVAAVPGVEEITSESAEGQSDVRVSFVWGTDLDVAANDIRDRLDRIADSLPEDARTPQLRKFDVNSFPVLILGVSSSLDPIELTELIEDEIQYRIERIPGVAAVETWGGFNREIQINLDPDRIKALGLPLNQILDSLRDANVNVPAGQIERGDVEVTLRTPGEFTSAEQIAGTVVAVREGAPVLLGQIATVEDTYQKLTRLVRINGEAGVRIGVRKQADANTVDVARRVLEEVELINEELPQAKVIPVINQATYIERSIANVTQSVYVGGGLAIFVLLFFLRNLRSTIVIAVAIPISIIATFALIYFGGFTLNLMTLGGLALGVGMMVDNSIVVLENIFRHRDEEGADRTGAAVMGTGEVAAAVIASTLTTVVIFLPLVFVRGVSGILFQQLAYVIAFSLICSLFVALSLVPMLASKVLKSPSELHESRPGWIERLAGRADGAFRQLDFAYRDLLRAVLKHRALTVGFAALLLVGSFMLYPLIGSEFMPPSDEGEVRVSGEMAQGTRLELVDEQTRKMESLIAGAIPEATDVVVSVGGGWGSATPEGEIRLSLVSATERERSNTQIAEDLRQRLEGKVAGMEIRTRAPQGQFLLNRLLDNDSNLAVEIRGYELETLDALAARVMELIADVPGLTDIRSSREGGITQELIRIDRDKAADLGLTVRQVASALQTAVSGTRAGEFRQEGDAYRIVVRLEDAETLSIEEILDLTLATPTGDQVALRNIITLEPAIGPDEIERKDQQRIVSVSANVEGRDMGSVADEIQARLSQIPRPPGYEFTIAGSYEQQREAFNELAVSLVLALALVYMVLACQYESLRDPMVVMFSVPFAGVGVLVTLFVTDTTFNVQSFIGCIMLGGIVVNNAILLVDQAGQLLKADPALSAAEAAAEAGRRRLRPILMTTLTTILGLLPLALGMGEGAESQAPLARAVVGGLTGSTLVTLVLIPVVYSLFHPERAAERNAAAERDESAAPKAVVA